MAKLKEPKELIAEAGISLEYDYGVHRKRNVRYIEHLGIFEVGKEDFDRWANSGDFEFDLMQPKGQRAFLKWIDEKEE